MTRPWIDQKQTELEDWFRDLPRRRLPSVGNVFAVVTDRVVHVDRMRGDAVYKADYLSRPKEDH